ncbi:MAG TPA: hypothetical protein VHM19_01745 [Polyangiales bacterium]|nr:hypothetical protein [Polyangiales bacterium]
MRRLSLIGYALLCLACALVASRAAASPIFELVGGDDAGFAGRAMPAGPRAAYFNPALLLDVPSGATVGLFVLSQQLDVEVGARGESAACARGACDVPAVNGAGPESFRHADGTPVALPTLPTSWLEHGRSDGMQSLAARPRQAAGSGHDTHAFLALGLVNAPIPERFAFGVSVLMPLSDYMQARSFYNDEREQFFSNSLHHELYGDRLQAAGVAFGAAIRPFQALSIGASLTLDVASAARAPVYVSNLADLNTLLIDSRVGVSLQLAPHAGIALTPSKWLRLTGTVHSPQGTRIDTGFAYLIASGIEQRASQSFEIGYLPWTFGLGAELTMGGANDESLGLPVEHAAPVWTLGVSGTYALWSNYRDRHAEQPSGAYAWSDVFGASATARCRASHLGGYVSGTFAASPVPDQTGRSNYVDSDRVGVALGGSYELSLLGLPMTLALDTQLHRLLPRSTEKRSGRAADLVRDEVPDDAVGGTPRGPIPGRAGLQTNNPGFPSFASQGIVFGAGARISVAY